MQSAKVLVIEYELVIGQDIVDHLSDLGYVTLGPIDNYSDSKRLLQENDIDLALIDIKLNGKKDGVDLAQFIRSDIDIPFIFLSSLEHQDVVNRAKSVHPSAYLLKPFQAKSVSIAIDMALANHSLYKNTKPELPEAIVENALPIKKYLFLRKENSFCRVAFSDILWIKADGNYTEFHTAEEKCVQTIQLNKVLSRVPNNLFKRVHRSYLVNIEAVTGFMGNILHINDEKIPVSSAYREDVFSLFNSI